MRDLNHIIVIIVYFIFQKGNRQPYISRFLLVVNAPVAREVVSLKNNTRERKQSENFGGD
jgi:hypothetical protein